MLSTWVINKLKSPVILVLFCVVCSFLLIETSSKYTVNFSSEANSRSKLKNRFNFMMESWSDISMHSEQKNLFLGTSVYQYFLNPLVYDKKMSEAGFVTQSYNISYQGMVGIGLVSFINRLLAETDKNKIVFDTIFFEIIPSAENKKSYNAHLNVIDIGNPDVFMNSDAWKKLIVNDPLSALYLYFVGTFRPLDWISLKNSFLKFDAFKSRKDKFAGITNIWSKPEFYEKPEWNKQMAGMVNWNFPDKEDEFSKKMDEMHTSEEWRRIMFEYIIGNSIDETYTYEESLIQYYIEAVNLTKKFAKNIVIVKLPLAPSFQKLVDQYVDEKYMIDKVLKATNVKYIDYTKINNNFSDNDFADPMHLKHHTMDFYIQRLAADMAVDKLNEKNRN